MYVEKKVIDITKLISSGLSINLYFILHCIYSKDKHLLEEYVNRIGKIDRLVFDSLQENGWIKINSESLIFDNLSLTEKSINLFKQQNSILDHKKFFKELREIYPKRVKISTGQYRPLHSNLEGCERKYKAIVESEEMHKKILLCVKAYVKNLEDTNKTEYIQLLLTWLNQKNYQVWMEQIDEGLSNIDIVDEYNVI